MAGRRHSNPEQGGGRSQKPKHVRGFARGHGMHHRPGGGAPKSFGSGRLRDNHEHRERSYRRFDDEKLADLPAEQRQATLRARLESGDDANIFGAPIQGPRARGTVVEVRKGHFLTELREAPEMPPGTTPLPEYLHTVLRGTLEQFDRGLASLVASGDEVEVVVPPVHGDETYEAVLTRVFPRTSEFRRLHPSGRSIQTIAANVQQVLVVASAAEPLFRPGFVDRLHVCALSCDLPIALVLNKTDLGVPEDVEEMLAVYAKLGLPIVRTSAETGAGLDGLRKLVSGKRSVFCGHSGVGKSSLLAALEPDFDGYITVGEVSTYTSKGTHTTTHARLYHVDDGELIDAPGVREFTPADTDRKNLWAWFPEIAGRRAGCNFSDCTHTVEKGCAILAAVEAGEIHSRRHESYVRMYQTLPV
ncbi:MAG: ribosome small subunit-dependent GTPase A [Planctomycetota bacterium]|nr:ribosome small subunit-dependent GTPase A [Planctomycetota bacterium]